MKRPAKPASKNETHVLVPAAALDELLEAIWEWAFADYEATPPVDRKAHFFLAIVRLDSDLHGLTVEESWERINAWRANRQQE